MAVARRCYGSAKPDGGRAGRGGRHLRRLIPAVLSMAALAAVGPSAAQAVEAPVITSVSPDHGQIGVIKGDQNPPITITGENLQEATVTAPDFWRESGEQEFEVVEDTGTSLVFKSLFANVPGIREIDVHTPGGTATTSVTYTPWPVTDPVIGRCNGGAPESGEYMDSKCIYRLGPGFGSYEWSEALASPTVTFTGGAFTFGFYPRVKCTSVTGSGSLLNGREVNNVVLTFHGCERELSGSCTNTATAGDVETEPLLLSFGWYKRHWPKGKKKPAVGLFSELIEGTIAQFRCGSDSVGFGGGWEAAVKATKPKTSLPMTFSRFVHGTEEPMIFQQWPFWSAEDVPLIIVNGESTGGEGTTGSLSMNAPEPFLLNAEK